MSLLKFNALKVRQGDEQEVQAYQKETNKIVKKLQNNQAVNFNAMKAADLACQSDQAIMEFSKAFSKEFGQKIQFNLLIFSLRLEA